MPQQKTYTPDRLVLLSTAADHLKSNPDATALQLMQLFALSQGEATGVVHSVAHSNAVPAEQMQEAIDWAVANNAGFGSVQKRYGMSENNARRVALSAKLVNAEKLKDHEERLAKSYEYAIAHPHETSRAVAQKFGVSPNSIQRARRIWRQGKEVQHEKAAASDVRKKRPELYAKTQKGDLVPCYKLKSNDRIMQCLVVRV